MILELHDNEKGNTLCASIPDIDFDYQAEQYVQDTYQEPQAAKVVKWLLKDKFGIRCQWERPIGSSNLPEITRRSERFKGEWQKKPREGEIVDDCKKHRKSAEKGPVAFALRVILLGAVTIALIMFVDIPLGWFGKSTTVARQEFDSKVSLIKYEWFIDQAERINELDQNIKIFEKRLADVDQVFLAYGDRSKWLTDTRVLYNHERQIARDDLVALKLQRNSLVQEYNAQSEKFNWKLFLTRNDKPAERFEVYGL